MAPLPPPHSSVRPSSSSSSSSSPCSSSSSLGVTTAAECPHQGGSCRRPALDLRLNGGVLHIVQARGGLPPLPSALHGLLRGHGGRVVAARLAELQRAAEQALAKTQAALESAVAKAARAWSQLPGHVHALQQQQQRGRIAGPRNSASLRSHNFAAIIPGDSVAEIVVTSSIFNFLNIYNTLLITRLILTWFPNPPEIIANPLSTICDPYLNIFRGIIPPLGGTLDLSPILAFLVLNVFTNTASALPAEMPKDPSSSSSLLGAASGLAADNLGAQPTWRQRAQSRKAGIVRKQVIAANKEEEDSR